MGKRTVRKQLFNMSFIVFLLVMLSVNAQCLDTGGIGSFTNQPTFASNWFNASEGNASYTVTSEGTYYGDASLKVNVTVDSPWEVRMFNSADCYFNLIGGQEYTISFYAKGTVGNEFKVTLMDALVNITSQTQQVRLDEWTFYTLTLTSDVTTSEGRIKFNFLKEGIYEIDEIVVKSGGFTTWYVDDNGSDTNAGNDMTTPYKSISKAVSSWTTGDIIYVMDGTYRNSGYGNGEIDNGALVNINKAGTLNGPLVIRNYPGHTPKIEFDGSGGFVCGTGIHLEISGFEIQGPSQQITKEAAESYRLIQNTYYKGMGITVWASGGGHHVTLHSNKVYDCPGSGVRINNSDYCILTNNEVYNCTLWTSSGSSAVVLAQSKSFDNKEKIKMRITKNRVYDNLNKIHYFNHNYDCSNTSDYGCPDFPNIIDGSGCYITRNNDRGTGENDENPNGQYTGYFYFANNIAYGNGINGLVVHKSDYSIVVNNTIYNNGAVPLSEGRQAAGGIAINNSKEVRIYNNISWTRFTTDYSYRVFGATSNIKGKNNISYNGQSNAGGVTSMINANPGFVDESNFDFRLSANSAALDTGIANSGMLLFSGTTAAEYTPTFDFENNLRGVTLIDIGAYESVDLDGNGTADHLENLSVDAFENTASTFVYPNPAKSTISVQGISRSDQITIFDARGKLYMSVGNLNILNGKGTLEIAHLPLGLYLIKIDGARGPKTMRFVKM